MALVRQDGLNSYNCSFKQWWKELTKAKGGDRLRERMTVSAFILWQVWKAHNAWYFNKEYWEPKVIIDRAVREWMNIRKPVKGRECEKYNVGY